MNGATISAPDLNSGHCDCLACDLWLLQLHSQLSYYTNEMCSYVSVWLILLILRLMKNDYSDFSDFIKT